MACRLARTRLGIRLFSAVLFSIVAAGCHKKVAPLVSDLQFSDKKSERQLISGFYAAEGEGWRWTKHRFAAVLAVPPGSQTAGATLQMRLYIPESQIDDLGPMTLSADIRDTS